MRNIWDKISFSMFVLFVIALSLSGGVAGVLLSLPFTGEGWDYAAIELWGWQLPFIPIIRGFFWLVLCSAISFLFFVAWISNREEL